MHKKPKCFKCIPQDYPLLGLVDIAACQMPTAELRSGAQVVYPMMHAAMTVLGVVRPIPLIEIVYRVASFRG
jgi:hypothetical protein